MKKGIQGMVALAAGLVVLVGCAATKSAQGEAAARRDVLYTCNCGPECTCNAVSTRPGKCPCGTEMKWGHVVKVEGDEALLCTCGKGCTCALDASDPTKCACGKPIKRVSLKGSGVYFCNCGGSCTCNTVSDRPGTCRCGMPLKQAM
ncbi:MAG: hypothetical protein Kow0092_16740 [Deferrisomatales bacterium]